MSAIKRFWDGIVLPHVPRFIRNDFLRILFSMIFAFLLTAVAHRNARMKADMIKMQFVEIPVSFVPANGESFSLVPRESVLTVAIEAEVPGDLKDLKNADFYVECPVSKTQLDAKAPEPLILKPGNVKTRRVIDNLNVLAIHPDSFSMDLDYYFEKDIPVLPTFDMNELMPGYRIVDADAEKRVRVRIRGPKKLLETIDHLETDKIPLSNMDRTFSCMVRPVLPNTVRGDNVRILSDTVRMDIRIEEKLPRKLEYVPLRVLTDRLGANKLNIVNIEPETVTVYVDDVPGVSRDQVHPFLDLSNLTQSGVRTVDIKCWSDNGTIKVKSIEPKTATVTLESSVPVPLSN